ncbi:MAG: hypothetical protein M5U26_10355 [Planctomycetota bacterium]|nr:hypothetical protein [Planctomycetota bacterium]
MDSLEGQFDAIRRAVREVVLGLLVGFWLHGRGGTGKSFTVKQELEKLVPKFKPANITRLTARGLFELIQDGPNSVHLIEDCEQLFEDAQAMSLLRHALNVEPEDRTLFPDRVVTWKTAKGTETVRFTGGLILVSNEIPARFKPRCDALLSRLQVFEFNPTNEEVSHLMYRAAANGHARYDVEASFHLSPEECREVVDVLIETYDAVSQPLDMRMMEKSYNKALYLKNWEPNVDWREAVSSMVRRKLDTGGRPSKAQLREIAKKIHRTITGTEARKAAWKEQTKLGGTAFYKYLGR